MEAAGKKRSLDIEFQVFCSDGSCQHRENGYRIDRTFSPSSICKIFGDPHFVDFNGRAFDYQGKGNFLLTKTPRLAVHGVFVPWSNPSISVSQEIAFNYMGTAYSVFFMTGTGKLTLNQISYNEQHPVTPVLNNNKNPTSVIFNLPDGSQILASRHNYQIKLPASYKGQTEGLCGKYDGKSRHANGNEWRVADQDYLAKKPFAWPALPAVNRPSQVCPVLVFPEIPKPTPVATTAYTTVVETTAVVTTVVDSKTTVTTVVVESTTTVVQEPTAKPAPYVLDPVKGTDSDVPAGYVAVKHEEVPQYVENKPAEKYANPNLGPAIDKKEAEAHCIKALDIPGCAKLVDRKPYVDACLTDCASLKTLDLVEASRIAYMSACKAAVQSEKQLGNTQQKSTCKAIEKDLGFGSHECPSNCNGRGSCGLAGCICSGGFSGFDCAIPPTPKYSETDAREHKAEPTVNATPAPVKTESAPEVKSETKNETKNADPAHSDVAPAAATPPKASETKEKPAEIEVANESTKTTPDEALTQDQEKRPDDALVTASGASFLNIVSIWTLLAVALI